MGGDVTQWGHGIFTSFFSRVKAVCRLLCARAISLARTCCNLNLLLTALCCFCYCRELLDGEYRQVLDDLLIMRQEVLPLGNNGVNIPVNLRRLIWNAQNTYKCGPDRPPLPGELAAVDVVNKIKVCGCGAAWRA